MRAERFAVVAGGGTGGHVFEALAIAKALEDRGHDAGTIELVGSRRGQEAVLLSGERFAVTLLPGRGIVRRWSREAFVANAGAIAGLAWAVCLAFASLLRRRPRVLVSVGGYASFPADLAAAVLGVPLVLVTIDAVPGLVHRLFATRAAANAVAFASTSMPRATVTGVAVRPEIVAAARGPERAGAARAALGLPPDRATVAIVGGSLGARRLNAAAGDLAERWTSRGDRSIFHVVGRRNWDGAAEASTPGDARADGVHYRRVPFEERMAAVYEAADVLVCRAGASTIAELAVTGCPSVLVPLPGAPGDHQMHNARALADAGAALLVPDEECDGAHLSSALDELLSDPERLAAMARAARGLGKPDAAARIAELVEEHAR